MALKAGSMENKVSLIDLGYCGFLSWYDVLWLFDTVLVGGFVLLFSCVGSGVILDRVSFHGRFVHFHLPSFLPYRRTGMRRCCCRTVVRTAHRHRKDMVGLGK